MADALEDLRNRLSEVRKEADVCGKSMRAAYLERECRRLELHALEILIIKKEIEEEGPFRSMDDGKRLVMLSLNSKGNVRARTVARFAKNGNLLLTVPSMPMELVTNMSIHLTHAAAAKAFQAKPWTGRID